MLMLYLRNIYLLLNMTKEKVFNFIDINAALIKNNFFKFQRDAMCGTNIYGI